MYFLTVLDFYTIGSSTKPNVVSSIHHGIVSVERLPLHLEGEKRVNYRESDVIGKVIEEAGLTPRKLEGFFALNLADSHACRYTYDEIPQKYVWDKKLHCWSPKQRGVHYGRICYTHYSTGDKWFLRMLLDRVRGPTSFENLKTVYGTVFVTFQETCNALGYLQNDNEWHDCIVECDKYMLPPQILTS